MVLQFIMAVALLVSGVLMFLAARKLRNMPRRDDANRENR